MRFVSKALIASALIMFGAVGTAHATEVTTSNDAKGDSYSYEGTTNSASDHMAGEPNDGNLEGSGVRNVLKPFYIPQFNADGTPKLDAEGKQVYKTDWRSVPISNGVEPATIVHN